MDWQIVVVGIAFAAAVAFLGWWAWRSMGARARACGRHCGCARTGNRAAGPLIPVEQIALRQRV
jgi:hypothetical protein